MKPLVIGVVLAIAILALGFLVPAILPATVSSTTVQALQEAELARRQLHAYDASLPLAAARANVAELKEADFGRLVERSQEEFDTLGSEFSQLVNRVKSADRQNRMPESPVRALVPNPSNVQARVSELERSVRDNEQLLTGAARSSRSATQTDRDALGVGQVAGMVKLAEAGRLLAEARELRARLTAEQARLLAVATAGAEAQSERDRHAGLNVAEIRGVLDGHLDTITAALAESQAEVDRLSAEVAEREQTLAGLRGQLEETRTQRLTLEEMGFTVGDDASFEAYRAEYLRLSNTLRELEEREQLLAFGGIEGGRVAGDDLLKGTIEGGVTVVGLNELKRNLALVEDKLTRYTRARQALEDQKNLVTTMGGEARTWEAQYAARLETEATEVQQIRASMDELARQAFEQETAALAAAGNAATAFKSAKSAADRWTGEATSLQREKDLQRRNERLKLIAGDNFAAEAAASADAQAKTLVGRIYTERALGLADYLDTLARANELMPGSELDTVKKLQEQFTEAHDQAISILNEAREAYERLAQKQSSTSWVHQASLATVYHLLWLIDEFNAAQHRSNLLDQLGKVVEDRQQSPHLQQQVALYALVTGGAAAPQSDQPESEEPDSAESGDEEPGESGDDSDGD